MEELIESALEALVFSVPFPQGEDASCRVAPQVSSRPAAPRAADQHVQAAGAVVLPAARGYVLGVTGQVRHEEHQEKKLEFLWAQNSLPSLRITKKCQAHP